MERQNRQRATANGGYGSASRAGAPVLALPRAASALGLELGAVWVGSGMDSEATKSGGAWWT